MARKSREHPLGNSPEEISARLHEELADRIGELTSGDSWKAWLDLASRLPTYSFRNQLLIWSQNPEARMVAGTKMWNSLGRRIRKGERSLKIFEPVTRKIEASEDADGAQEGQGRRLVGFRVGSRFDVSQTEGEPLPEPPEVSLLPGQAPEGLWDSLARMVEAEGFTLHRCPTAADIGGANGVTHFGKRTVTVRSDVDDAQAVKTLAHELGHVLLHSPEQADEAPLACRGTVEVEAESVAYIVSGSHGLDTSTYSFGYIAGWAASVDDPAEVVAATGQRVVRAAGKVIAGTTPADAAALTARGAAAGHALGGSIAKAEELTVRLAEPTTTTRPARQPQVEAVNSGRAELLACTADAQTYFHRNGPGSQPWEDALIERKISPLDAEQYGIGYAGTGWTDLVDHLRRAGHSEEVMRELGLAVPGKHGLIDAFRGRITFPYITDEGNVVAFTGRIAVPHQEGTPKYINSPTSTIFSKSERLLGWQAVTDHTRQLVVVEGPWDAAAITAATGGAAAGLSSNGTALTRLHAEQLRDAGLPITYWPDPDTAGMLGAANAYRTLTMVGCENLTMIQVKAFDPSEYHARFHDGDAIPRSLVAPLPLVNAVVETQLRDKASIQEAVSAARRIGAALTFSSPADLSAAATRVASKSGIDPLAAHEAIAEGWASGKAGTVPVAGDGGDRTLIRDQGQVRTNDGITISR